MSLAPWRSPLSRALHRNRSLPNARYVQLATVRSDGRPANRTLVFRGFFAETNQLKFVTDARSEKPAQIAHSPWAEVCWYFPNTREQFRILGQLKLVCENDTNESLQKARAIAWQELSDSARIQFAWATPRQPRAAAAAFSPPTPDPRSPLPQFCLLLLDPTEVGHLELRGDPQNRYHYLQQDSGDWSYASLNP